MQNWQPATKAQKDALSCPADLLLFGGAAGSLKSETLLVDAAQEIDKASLSAIVFRRTFPELVQLIRRSRELYSNLGGTFNEQKKLWKFASGAEIRFAYCERDDDVYQYQGQEFSWIGWDESTHHAEFRIRYLLSRLRSTDPTMWQRCRLATNPGGIGHAWHKHMFLGGVCPHCQPPVRVPNQIYIDAVWTSDKKPLGMSTAFILGKVRDHNLLGETYEQRLEMQSGATAKALLEGCWQMFEGLYYDCFDMKRNVVTRQEIGDQYFWPHWVGADYGFSGSQAAAYLFATDHNGIIYCLQEHMAQRSDVRAWANSLAAEMCCKKHTDSQPRHMQALYLSPDMWNNRGDNNTLADQMNEELDRYGLAFTKANNDRAGGAMLIYTMLQSGRLRIADTCPGIIEALQTRIHDEKEPEKVQKVIGDPLDDCFDGFRYGIYSYEQAATKPRQMQVREKLEGLDPTSAMIRYPNVLAEIDGTTAVVPLGRRGLSNLRRSGRKFL